ncbi:MAG: hypothetical protein GF398_19400 [Chitinivibrionales bacterium]|nr:hypothetical protein [Chitinivibrionales bacterium]
MNGALSFLAWFGKIYMAMYDAITIFICHTSQFCKLISGSFLRLHLIFKNIHLSITQMYRVGIESLPLVTITSIFLGAETVIMAHYIFANLIPKKFLGVAVLKGIVNEIGPVVTSLIISGRVSTAIAAEVGSMKTTEQLDAMTILSLDPIRYLYLPKMIACIVMLPVLTIWAEFISIMGSIATVVVALEDISLYVYMSGLKLLFNTPDVINGILKTALFGMVIAMTGCHFGMLALGGAQGVGQATTKTVMTNAALILILDFIVAIIIW